MQAAHQACTLAAARLHHDFALVLLSCHAGDCTTSAADSNISMKTKLGGKVPCLHCMPVISAAAGNLTHTATTVMMAESTHILAAICAQTLVQNTDQHTAQGTLWEQA